MKTLFVVLIVPLCLAITPKGVYFPIEDGLTVFTSQTYKEIMSYHDTFFLLFFAPWCGMCERGVPQLEEVAREIQKDFPKVVFAKVNGESNMQVLYHFNVNGYPTYLIIHKDKIMGEFFPSVTSERIRAFIKEKLMPFGEEVTSIKEIEDLRAANDAIIVYFGEKDEDVSTITSSLLFHTDLPFQFCDSHDNHDMKAKYSLRSPRTIKLFKKYDEKEHELVMKDNEPLTKQQIDHFIDLYAMPLVMEYNQKTFDFIFTKHHSALFFIQSKKDQFKAKDLLDIAKEFRGKVSVVSIDSFESDFNKNFLSKNQITENELPLIRYFDTINAPRQYPIESSYEDISAVKKAVTQLIEKKANAKAISSDISSVYVLDANTFQKEVIDNDMDVLVKFYAPWCGHCKSLAPIYEELASKFSSSYPKIRIAEMDSTIHQISWIKITGYPTLMLFVSGNKANPILYEGERNYDDMEVFLMQNAKNAAFSLNNF